MLHTARRTLPGTLLFHDWRQAGWLWRAIAARVPGIAALVLMPDHLHLLTRRPVDRPLGDALRAYALWRGEGRLFRREGPPVPVAGPQKERRNVRYIALNPCRGRLVEDPLAWAFSTHRDAVGLSLSPVRRADTDPAGLHRYVSSDPTVGVDGSDLPFGRARHGIELEIVRAAVSSLTRRTLDELDTPGPARTVLLGAADALVPGPRRALADALRCHRTTLRRARQQVDARVVGLVERVAGDPRFPGLPDGDLRGRLRRRWHATPGPMHHR